nr:MAG TPA: hypothetical protein [Caudoviricetes sp.]
MFTFKKKTYDDMIRKEVDEIVDSQRNTIESFKVNIETLKLLLKEES